MGKIGRAPLPADADAYFPVAKMLISFIHRQGYGEILSVEGHSGISRYPFTVGFCVPKTLRSTYEHILARRAFACNVPDAGMADIVKRCEAIQGTEGDKFAALGLTARRGLMTETLLIDDCAVAMELRLRQFWPVGTYDFIIGELVLAHTDIEVIERRRSMEWQQTPRLVKAEAK